MQTQCRLVFVTISSKQECSISQSLAAEEEEGKQVPPIDFYSSRQTQTKVQLAECPSISHVQYPDRVIVRQSERNITEDNVLIRIQKNWPG